MSLKTEFAGYFEEIKDHAITQLKERQDTCTEYGADLHNELFNTDYYIIGTAKAKKWCAENTFDIIEAIKTYENDYFGEVSTDFSSPEKVVNMFVYIIGEEVLAESDHLSDDCWDRNLDSDDIAKIISELED